MILHPSVHLEIARQRYIDLLAEAERERIAKALDHSSATGKVRRQRRRPGGALRPALESEIARHSDVEVGLEA